MLPDASPRVNLLLLGFQQQPQLSCSALGCMWLCFWLADTEHGRHGTGHLEQAVKCGLVQRRIVNRKGQKGQKNHSSGQLWRSIRGLLKSEFSRPSASPWLNIAYPWLSVAGLVLAPKQLCPGDPWVVLREPGAEKAAPSEAKESCGAPWQLVRW